MRIALKIDVDTLRGAMEGVPKLLELLDTYQVKASFFFSVGPDDSLGGVSRILGNFRELGTGAFSGKGLLQGPMIAGKAAASMQAVVKSGHDIGLRAYEARNWGRIAAHSNADWSRHQMALAVEAFEQALGFQPRLFAACHWQLNPHLLALEERLGFTFASDTRGKYPFYPQLQNTLSHCPQIPTTLPTLDELLNQPGISLENAHEHLYVASRKLLPTGHVYSAQAELEGLTRLDFLERMLVMWKGQEGSVRSLSALYNELDLSSLPVHQVGWGQVEGCERHLAMQSIEVTQ